MAPPHPFPQGGGGSLGAGLPIHAAAQQLQRLQRLRGAARLHGGRLRAAEERGGGVDLWTAPWVKHLGFWGGFVGGISVIFEI